MKKKFCEIVGALRCKYNFVKMLAPKWYLVQLQNAKQTVRKLCLALGAAIKVLI